MDVTTDKHNYGIDLYRIICMVMISCLHIMGWGGIGRNPLVDME